MSGRRKRGESGPDKAGAALARLLRRLAEPGAHLAPLSGAESPAFALFTGKRLRGGAALRLDAAQLRELLAAGLIAPLAGFPGALGLTAAGRAFLRRAEAEGQPFEAQHRAMGARYIADVPGKAGMRHAVNLAESPLAWLANRKDGQGAPLLGAALIEAGERLREDYERAHLMPQLTVNWERPMARGAQAPESLTLTEAAMAARQRVGAALAAVGPELETVLIAICCHLQGLEAAERQLRLPPRAGKVVLKIALEALARHYGIIRPRTRAEMSSWRSY